MTTVWKIADFGFSTERASTTTLETDARRGTPSYRAPELLRKIPSFNDRTDIWALGCILYELASGKKAFGDDWDVLEYTRMNMKFTVQFEPFVEMDIRLPLANLVLAMLEVHPKARPSSNELRTLFSAMIDEGSFSQHWQEEIRSLYLRISQESLQLNQPEPSRSIIFSVPYERYPYFTGRDEFLNNLAQQFSERKANRYNHRIALYGLGGVGKTQIALEYAYRHEEDYAYVFWISAVDQVQLLSGFGHIANSMRCALFLTKPEDIAKAVLRWLRITKSWLLIIDNLDDITLIDGYLPENHASGHTLITTRNTNSDGIPATGLEVKEMDYDDCVGFLLTRIRLVDPIDEMRAEARRIVDVLGCLPLAIEQAAAYIRTSKSLPEYLTTFEKHRHALLGWQLPGSHAYDYTVATTWRMSLERLKFTFPDSVELLQYLAFMNPDEILVEFLKDGIEALPINLQNLIENTYLWTQGVEALESFSLVRVFGKGGTRLRIHRLVQAVIQDQLDSSVKWNVVSSLIQMGLLCFPINTVLDMKEREKGRRFRSQVVGLLEQAKIARNNLHWLILAERMANYLYEDGFFNDACQWWSLTLDTKKEMFGMEHPSTLQTMYELGRSLYRLGRFKEAADLHNETLEIRKDVLGPEDPDTLVSMNSVAVMLRCLGRFKEAAVLLVETWNIQIKVLGSEHPDALMSMNNLAETYRCLGRFQEAESLDVETWALRKKVLGTEHPDTLASMNNLASSYTHLGRCEEATELLIANLDIRQRVLGPEHPNTLWSMHNLAELYKSQGEFKKAADMHAKTLNARKKVLGPEHPNTLFSMDNLAESLRSLGEFEEAVELHHENLNLRMKVLEPEHPNTLCSMNNLAESYRELGRLQEALELHVETLNIRTRVLGAEHPDTLLSIHNLAASQKALDQWKEAEE